MMKKATCSALSAGLKILNEYSAPQITACPAEVVHRKKAAMLKQEPAQAVHARRITYQGPNRTDFRDQVTKYSHFPDLDLMNNHTFPASCSLDLLKSSYRTKVYNPG